MAARSNSSSALRTAIRSSNSQAARQRDELLHSVLSLDPRKLQAAVQSSKRAGTPAVHLLQVRAATVQAKMLSGRYRTCWLRRHWTQESWACRLPGCGMVPGHVAHLLSVEGPALQPHLATTLQNLKVLLAPHPLLLPPVMAALHRARESVTTFFLDPSTDRAWMWAAHRSRMRLLGLEKYLL